MNKKVRLLFTFIFSFFVFVNNALAADFGFNFKTSGKATSSSINSNGATHLRTNITRGNSSGLRITLYKNNKGAYSVNEGPEDQLIEGDKVDILVDKVDIISKNNDYTGLTSWIDEANKELREIKIANYDGDAQTFLTI